MEQNYFDEIHKRSTDALTVFLKTFLVGTCVAVCPLVLMAFGGFGVILAAGVIYGAYYFWQKLSREYEYIFTDGELDIDVIYGRVRRQRLITIKPRQIEAMGVVTEAYQTYKQDPSVKKTLDFSDGSKENRYFLVVNSNQLKKLILFSPSDRLVEAMKPYLRERFLNV